MWVGAAMLDKLMTPVGPVAAGFVKSRAFISGIMGPVGGGKTVAGIARCFRLGLSQRALMSKERGCRVKKCRIMAVRDTYPNLDRTLIKTWHQWVPKELGKWSGDAPRTHTFTIDVGRRGDPNFHQLDMEIIFSALGENSIEDIMRGFEGTGLWGNEWDLLGRMFLEFGVGRVGRYPSVSEGGCRISQIWGDFNAPDEDNHLYDLFENKNIDPELAEAIAAQTGGKQPLIEFFEQPGGMEERAENLHNLDPTGEGDRERGRLYYVKQKALMTETVARRMVDNKWGAVRSGMPVYPEFSNRMHVGECEPIMGLPLRIAMDAGLTPAAVIAQKTAYGQMIVLAELATILRDEDQDLEAVGPTAFGEKLRTLLDTKFAGMSIESCVVDPAASKGTDRSGNELTWLQTAAKAARLRIKPAPVANNDLTIRLEAVRRPLKRLVDHGRPGLVIDTRCTTLKRGFNSGYVYKRTAVAGGDSRYEDKPAKNQFSHIHDALQYLMVAAGEGRVADTGRGSLGERGKASVSVLSDYNMFG